MTTTILKGSVIAGLALLLAAGALIQGTLGREALALALEPGRSAAFESHLTPPGGARWNTVHMDGQAVPFREGASPLPPVELMATFARQLAVRGYVPLRWLPRRDGRLAGQILRRGAFVELLGPRVASIGYMDPEGRTAAAVAWPGPGGAGSCYVIGGLVAAGAGDAPEWDLDGGLDALESGDASVTELLRGR